MSHCRFGECRVIWDLCSRYFKMFGCLWGFFFSRCACFMKVSALLFWFRFCNRSLRSDLNGTNSHLASGLCVREDFQAKWDEGGREIGAKWGCEDEVEGWNIMRRVCVDYHATWSEHRVQFPCLLKILSGKTRWWWCQEDIPNIPARSCRCILFRVFRYRIAGFSMFMPLQEWHCFSLRLSVRWCVCGGEKALQVLGADKSSER